MATDTTELRKDLAALRLDRPATTASFGRRRLLLGAGVVVVLAVVAMMRMRSGTAPRVEAARVTTIAERSAGSALVPVLAGSGYVVSAERYVAIGVRVPGRIERYFVEEGDRVAANDPLVEIDQREYQAAVAKAEANLVHARADATLKSKQLARARALARTGVISRDELDVRTADAATSAAAIQQAEADLQSARVALEYTVLRAPTSGVILAKLKEVGEIAVPGGFSGSGDLIRIANLTDLRGQVDITEGEIAKIRMQQRAEVLPDAYPDKKYAAKVVKLYPQVDRQKGTLRVEVQIEQPDEFLWPDMSARITFFEAATAAGGKVVLVPRSAVHRDGENAYVWRIDDGKAARIAITLGRDYGEQVQATSGLDGTETVVAGDAAAVVDGRAVTIADGAK